MKRYGALAVALLWSVQAYSITIDFSEEITRYYTEEGYDGFLVEGFRIEMGPLDNQTGPIDTVDNIYESLVVNNPPFCCAEVDLMTESGAAFNLDSVYLGTVQSVGENPWSVIGYQAGGGTVTLNNVTGVINFDDQWNNLTSVTFSVDGLYSYFSEIDDISVSVVPIPAAAWLFGSALAGLGWLRRKKTG